MASTPFVCASCARAMRVNTLARTTLPQTRRHLSRSRRSSLPADAADASHPNRSEHGASNKPSQQTPSTSSSPSPAPAPGPMTTRLQQTTEDALLTGGRAGRRAIEEAGFSDELKAKLLDKVAGANFQDHPSATLAHAGLASRLPDSAGLGTRAMASAQPWTGSESTEDAVLRMLDDARKPLAVGLRGKGKVPVVPQPVDMRIRREGVGVSPGRRAAGARDKAQVYAGMGMKEVGLSEEEREAMKREFRERFAPGARAMPNTMSGLAALANERIEDAIARGQFKNIPRGKGIERDRRADNPFIDTTEYIMNKMIKRQDIVPPWIEKQQELVKAADNFRGRLRHDWKRHAARVISSRGGTLEQQIARANAHARAEEVHNPRRRSPEHIAVPTNSTDDAVMNPATPSPPPTSDQPPPDQEIAHPFRDPTWQTTESAYMTLAVANLNRLARSYNLMAPELARKPYYSLERELQSCFADVAPQVAGEIRARATKPAGKSFGTGGQSAGLGLGGDMRGLFGGGSGGGGSRVSVVEGREKEYGWREFWRDLWGGR